MSFQTEKINKTSSFLKTETTKRDFTEKKKLSQKTPRVKRSSF